MNANRNILLLCLLALFLVSCSTVQSRYSMLDDSYPAKPESYEVQVYYHDNLPQRPFARISRIDVHLEKTHFRDSALEDAMPELKNQARLSGADAIIEIREKFSSRLETSIYHVTATGIRFTD